MKAPDITPAQILAVLTFFASQAVAFGWLTDGTNQRFMSVAGTVVPIVLKVVDGWIRGNRAKHIGSKLPSAQV